YYQEIKVARLKELLRNPDLSISQAFTACGLEHWGNATRFFKQKVGMTPTQYRATLRDEPSGTFAGPASAGSDSRALH
ncbi:MAG: helix-turn-helix transcriptional regulator, partial [Propionibacteriaceae bacterium]|nr:helix-turn-helix transcriptional regulator [Propionibacteriaceae bacterium]